MGTGNQHPQGGLELGYARVSTTKQSLDRRLAVLAAAGIGDERIHADKKTGPAVDRDGLNRLLAYARSGDTIVVHTLDRIGRNLREVLNLAEKGIGIRSLADPLPISTPTRAWAASFSCCSPCSPRWRAPSPPSAPATPAPSPKPPAARSSAPEDKIEYARLLKSQGDSLGVIAAKTGIPKTSLHRYLDRTSQRVGMGGRQGDHIGLPPPGMDRPSRGAHASLRPLQSTGVSSHRPSRMTVRPTNS
ncbi:recombinase family protein [Actinomadura litoris]|uniref:recombinase family protein n=1 Tax=Actinomadura litoris TaxID=2678616 RepID=UPI001C12C3E3|nr:recombinase family protein [Actinomadura litoris]